MSHLDGVKELGVILEQSKRTHLLPTEIHGLLSGILCGPKVISPVQWLGCIFPGAKDMKTLLKKAWFGRMVELLISCYEDLLFALRAGTFIPYLTDKEKDKEKLQAAKEWCTGFLYGMHLHGESWSSNTDEYLASLTAPLFYLADPEHVAEEMNKKERAKLAEKAVQMIGLIRYNVPKIYDTWNMGVKPEVKKEFFNPKTASG